jgi:hypothetical protein
MRRFTTTLLLLVVPWVVIGAIWRLSIGQEQKGKDRDEAATTIEPGIMNERQKQHSKLYDEFYPRGHGRLDEDPQNQRIRDFQSNMYKPPGLEPQMPRMTAAEFMRGPWCAADAVIVGNVSDKASQLVASAQFLFTEYNLVVENVYKNNTLAPIAVGNNLTVVRPGGKVQIHGRVVRTVDGCYLPLDIGSRVLLFLKYLPQTKSYDSAVARGSFKIENGTVIPLTDQNVPGFVTNVPVDLTSTMGSVTTSDCLK